MRNNERMRSAEARLGREMGVWLSTVSPDGMPHMEPNWFVWLDGIMYVTIGTETQQWANLMESQSIIAAMPSTDNVLIVEGVASVADRQTKEQLADYYYNKYGWDFTQDDSADWRLISITPNRILAWGDGYDQLGIRLL